MSKIKQEFDKFTDPWSIPTIQDIRMFIEQYEGVPIEESIDVYMDGEKAILDWIAGGQVGHRFEYVFEKAFKLPVHASIPILIEIIEELIKKNKLH